MHAPSLAPGRPLDATVHACLLRVTQNLLIEQGFERLSVDAVANLPPLTKPQPRWRARGPTCSQTTAAKPCW